MDASFIYSVQYRHLESRESQTRPALITCTTPPHIIAVVFSPIIPPDLVFYDNDETHTSTPDLSRCYGSVAAAGSYFTYPPA
jgi:hypothetical protein